jgi:hypothetical protein
MEQNQLLVVVAGANPAKDKSRLLDDSFISNPASHTSGVTLGSVVSLK